MTTREKSRKKAGMATTDWTPSLERLGFAAREQKAENANKRGARRDDDEIRLKKTGRKTLWEQSKEKHGIK
jgi:hypothetical protein